MGNQFRINSSTTVLAASLFLVLLSGPLMAQSDLLNVLPEKVLANFSKHYPDVSGVEWIRDQNKFIAEFEQNDKDHQLWMSEHGEIVKHVVTIADELLPAAITQRILKVFPSGKILSVYQVNQQNRNYYQIKLKHDHEKLDYFVDENGNEVSGS